MPKESSVSIQHFIESPVLSCRDHLLDRPLEHWMLRPQLHPLETSPVNLGSEGTCVNHVCTTVMQEQYTMWCNTPVTQHLINESTEVQNPRRNSYVQQQLATHAHSSCTAHARASASLPRVGLRLYLACFTPVAPVASL